jgi:EAL domain-containing protein (putative c-di-GMP-specific phosphodiesterase class I)
VIVELGNWVLGEACRQAKKWLDLDLGNLRMSVNLSVRQLRNANLAESVARTLDETGLPPAVLEFELTESSVMEHPEEAIGLLTSLKALGVGIAVDDFGTGYSSLTYLKLFPLDRLKIDRSFVSDLEDDDNDAAIVAAAVSLGHSLGLSVVAEGVETASAGRAPERTRLRRAPGFPFQPAHARRRGGSVPARASGYGHVAVSIARRPAWVAALLNRRMLICIVTGFASGLPLYLLLNLVPAWLRPRA